LLVAVFHQLGAAQSPSPLRVMTYNVRYASDEPPHVWNDRRPAAKAMLEQYRPDVIGMQEAVYRQVKDFAEDLPGYDWIGLGREGGSRGEFMAVFYRVERLRPLEFDHFWLSDTPDVIGSTTWGNSNRRMVTWVRFQDLQNDRSFYFLNTHFDHEIREAREKSAQLVVRRTVGLAADIPRVLVGDFNAAAEESRVYELFVGPDSFADTWHTAEQRGKPVGTFHGYRGPQPGGRRIDWILVRGPVKTLYTEIVTYSRDGQFPSDHFPVIADIAIDQTFERGQNE
jgi:endonuclease/exonuclease/phosphatase family metal-dependent hydrolase